MVAIMENIVSGISSALDVPMEYGEAEEESFIFRGVMNEVGAVRLRDVVAFCGRVGSWLW